MQRKPSILSHTLLEIQGNNLTQRKSSILPCTLLEERERERYIYIYISITPFDHLIYPFNPNRWTRKPKLKPDFRMNILVKAENPQLNDFKSVCDRMEGFLCIWLLHYIYFDMSYTLGPN
jgi:hypothetical protein